jgi:glycerol-3-phosphate acyltransferase PlsY
MLIALAPLALAAIVVVWVAVVWLTGYVSLGSIIAAGLFPLADYLLHPGRRSPVTLVIDLGLAAFIIWKHRANIQRLLAGSENRFGKRGAAKRAAPSA